MNIPGFTKLIQFDRVEMQVAIVVGLAPIFVFWNAKVGKWSFHLCVGTGVLFGLLLAFNIFPASLVFFEGKYGDLLSVNILGTIACLVMFWIGKWFK